MNVARILTVDAKISRELYKIDAEGPDRRGNVCLHGRNKSIRVHPKRVLPVKTGGAMVKLKDGRLVATCPKCKHEATVQFGATEIKCNTHGVSVLDWIGLPTGAIPMVERKAVKPIQPGQVRLRRNGASNRIKLPKEPLTIDFATLKAKGELWSKSGIRFDYPEFAVLAHALLVTVKGVTRKYCFNSYNGTWGKKSKQKEIEAFINNQPHNGKSVGFLVKGDVAKERKKLAKAHYTLEK